jgi:hypothetical protein
MKASKQRFPVETDQWSEQSRGGLDEAFAPKFYQDKHFVCRTCGEAATFSAAEQKHALEIQKVLIHKRRVLCQTCFERRKELLAEAALALAEWTNNKANILASIERIRRWKALLECLPSYGGRRDTARIRMLDRLLHAADSKAT